MHIKNFLFSLACISALCSLGSPIRDDMAGRNTDFSTGIPNVAFVEYLESDGNQFIDIYPQSETISEVKIDCGFLVNKASATGQNFVFGPSKTTRYLEGPRVLWFGRQIYVSCDGDSAAAIARLPTGQKAEIEVLYSRDNYIEWSVGALAGIINRNYYIQGNRFFRIFSIDDNRYNLTGRIYYFRLYIDGVLVRDLHPVRIGSTGYMYDALTGNLLGNDGTGEFIIGPDI